MGLPFDNRDPIQQIIPRRTNEEWICCKRAVLRRGVRVAQSGGKG